jgi:hypothetical protein
MKKRSKIFYGLGLVLCFSLITFQIFGCAEEAWKGGPAPSAAAPVVSTPQPYVTTGFPQVVVVSGTNYEMGVEYGEQAGAAIAHNVAMFKSRLYDKFGTETVTKDMQVWDYYLGKYDPVYKDWLRGIVDGCKQ